MDTDFEEGSRTSLSPPVDIRSAMPGLRHEGNLDARLWDSRCGEAWSIRLRFAGVEGNVEMEGVVGAFGVARIEVCKLRYSVGYLR
jgi:hypothetical protein